MNRIERMKQMNLKHFLGKSIRSRGRRAQRPHLVGDEVLTHGQRHLDGIGLVCDRDGVHLELLSAVQSIGLAHRLLEYLLIAFLAQHGADVHQPWLATAQSH